MAKLPNIIEKERSLGETILFVFRESFKASKKYSIIGYIAAMISAVFTVLQFGALGIIVNEFMVQGINGARTGVLIEGFLLLVVTQFGPSLLEILSDYSRNIQHDDISRYLQSMMFTKAEDLDIGTIEQPEFQNIREITNNRGWGSFFNFLQLFLNTITMLTKVIVTLIALLTFAPIVFIIILIGALPTYFLERKGAILSANIYKDTSEQWRIWRVRTTPLDYKDSVTELKNFSLVKIFKKKFLLIISSVHSIIKQNYRTRSLLSIASEVILLVSYSLAFFLLIKNVQSGELAVGSLVFTFGLVIQFQGSLNTLFSNFGKMSEHKKNLDTLLDFFEMEPFIKDGDRELLPENFEIIEIKNVSFSYPGSQNIVTQNLSITIKRGDNIAIVGLNGAGKTTFIKLLTRVYDPTEGEILVNGINLKEYNLKSWKKCLGILLQEYSMYSEETITENIMLGDTNKHDQNIVEQSAKDSTADEFITELPKQYNQKIGTEFEGGVELSKGQKQKIALARVFYRNAPIMILDEPTAAIDALSEDAIFKNLKNNYIGQTRIIISHKFSNVREADQIILIEHGKIIEQGNHDELMKIKAGKYKELFNLQAKGYRLKTKK